MKGQIQYHRCIAGRYDENQIVRTCVHATSETAPLSYRTGKTKSEAYFTLNGLKFTPKLLLGKG